jgi:hypothetical protein
LVVAVGVEEEFAEEFAGGGMDDSDAQVLDDLSIPRVLSSVLMWSVVYLKEAEQERLVLPKVERNALIHAVEKLEAFGPRLGYPHTSAVRGAVALRELRPRAGRSPWRALYRQVGAVFVIAAVGPEAESDHRGFERATRQAVARLAELEE